MARGKRIHYPGLVYHVINRGNNRQAIFLEEEDYELYLGLLYRYKLKFSFQIFSYCLMTNHVHLLIKVGEGGNISKIMQAITNAHTRHYHFKYRTSGHVWQGRFKSPIVGGDQHMLRVMQYIEQNPVRAKIVSRIENYKWSSYLLNARIKNSKLIDRFDNKSFMGLGINDNERTKIYKQKIKDNLKEKRCHEIRESSGSKDGYMSEKFRNQIDSMLPRKRGRGRPRKELIDK